MENLTIETFKNKVFDFENNKEWKFIGDKPAIIDFYAEWCSPCKQIHPILEKLSIEYKDKLDIYKINTEDEQELSQIFGIRSIPSLLFIPMGEQPQMLVGGIGMDKFKTLISDVLKVQ